MDTASKTENLAGVGLTPLLDAETADLLMTLHDECLDLPYLNDDYDEIVNRHVRLGDVLEIFNRRGI